MLVAHGVEKVGNDTRFIKSHYGFNYVFVHQYGEYGLDTHAILPVLSVSSDSVLVGEKKDPSRANAFDYAMSTLLHPQMFVVGSFSFLPGPGPYKIGVCDHCERDDQPLAPGLDSMDSHVMDVCVMGCTFIRNMKAYYAFKEVK
ncbi:hypothetical protein [Alkalicoccobacillus gibsonii]|uniref:hypothetical protein n=1 Tax=Alkalicoccobacillus gibsonii TaxID=79881 RepID=UPI0019340EB2|nr:hypothetical protein [Alkalicoccobacillus gibsonii]MBM0067950.1 hypothetical protein [Alkalicoccobacillus gibsonii]